MAPSQVAERDAEILRLDRELTYLGGVWSGMQLYGFYMLLHYNSYI